MVVVIDDDSVQGRVLAESISRQGIEAKHILHWSELQRILKLKTVNCLVIDYYLNDGWLGPELAKLLRSFGCAEIPIFFTSSDDSTVVRRQCEVVGHPFIPKKWRWLLTNMVIAKTMDRLKLARTG